MRVAVATAAFALGAGEGKSVCCRGNRCFSHLETRGSTCCHGNCWYPARGRGKAKWSQETEWKTTMVEVRITTVAPPPPLSLSLSSLPCFLFIFPPPPVLRLVSYDAAENFIDTSLVDCSCLFCIFFPDCSTFFFFFSTFVFGALSSSAYTSLPSTFTIVRYTFCVDFFPHHNLL